MFSNSHVQHAALAIARGEDEAEFFALTALLLEPLNSHETLDPGFDRPDVPRISPQRVRALRQPIQCSLVEKGIKFSTDRVRCVSASWSCDIVGIPRSRVLKCSLQQRDPRPDCQEALSLHFAGHEAGSSPSQARSALLMVWALGDPVGVEGLAKGLLGFTAACIVYECVGVWFSCVACMSTSMFV